MSIRQIVTLPDESLRLPSNPVIEINAEIRKIANDMLDTMRKHHASGLAAVQIGKPLRIIAVNPRFCSYHLMVNPQIVGRSQGTLNAVEGCLSIPGRKFHVKRADAIVVTFMDRADQQHQVRFEGYAARIIQHEIDHLDGKCIDVTGEEADASKNGKAAA